MSLTNTVIIQVSSKRYAPIRVRTKAFVVEAWRFPGEAKMLVSQNCTKRNYINSITYQVLISANKNKDLIFTDILSAKVKFQQIVKDNNNWTFLIAFAFLKKSLVFFGAIYQRRMITSESSPAYMACRRNKLIYFSLIL